MNSLPLQILERYMNAIFRIIFPNWELFPTFVLNLLLRVIAKKILRDFWVKHPDSEQQLKSWYQEAEDAEWRSPKGIKKNYPSASILPGNRVVFNIKGNHYRLIVKVNYDYGMVWIRFIGTHSAYDKVNAETI